MSLKFPFKFGIREDNRQLAKPLIMTMPKIDCCLLSDMMYAPLSRSLDRVEAIVSVNSTPEEISRVITDTRKWFDDPFSWVDACREYAKYCNSVNALEVKMLMTRTVTRHGRVALEQGLEWFNEYGVTCSYLFPKGHKTWGLDSGYADFGGIESNNQIFGLTYKAFMGVWPKNHLPIHDPSHLLPSTVSPGVFGIGIGEEYYRIYDRAGVPISQMLRSTWNAMNPSNRQLLELWYEEQVKSFIE